VLGCCFGRSDSHRLFSSLRYRRKSRCSCMTETFSFLLLPIPLRVFFGPLILTCPVQNVCHCLLWNRRLATGASDIFFLSFFFFFFAPNLKTLFRPPRWSVVHGPPSPAWLTFGNFGPRRLSEAIRPFFLIETTAWPLTEPPFLLPPRLMV